MSQVYDGPDSLAEIGPILEREAPRSLLILRDSRSYGACGAAQKIDPQLSGRSVAIVDIAVKIPTVEDIGSVIAQIRRVSSDFIIAVGGGTVLDIAKAASVLQATEGDLRAAIRDGEALSGSAIPKILVPTTAGTGAESTPFAVVYIAGKKHSLYDSRLPGEYIILAPELTHSLNGRITAETGCDALAQAVEGYWSIRATPESKTFSAEALTLILKNLPPAVRSPDPPNRRAMLLGAHLAGKSIAVARTTVAHSLSYPLTARFGIAHGHAVMLTLPYFFPLLDRADADAISKGANLATVRRNFSELLAILGVRSGDEAMEKLLALMDSLGLERRLSAFGIGSGDIETILQSGFTPDRVENHPCKIGYREVEAILRHIL